MASAGILVSEEVVHRAIETVIADNDSVSRKEASLSTLLIVLIILKSYY